jgi:glycosyltransferase involved in cell wall biosynthesis
MALEITVLMPVHNGEAFVKEASESILSQTFQDLELLVIDDASTDQTVKVLESLNDPRVRIIKSRKRLRFSGALNLGIEHATGIFLARMDGDDIALPNRLALQHDYMLAHPEVGLCGGLATTFGMREGLLFRPPLTHGEIVSYMLFDCPFAHPTVMLRRDLMERYQLRYNPAYCPTDDYELWRRAARLFPVANINKVLLRYRVHASSLTQSEWGDMDGHAARISALELADLGVTASGDELHFHRNLGRGRCFPIKRRDELERAEAWLKKLIAANAHSKRYPANEFVHIVAGIWFSACYHAGSLGVWMLKRYACSPLRFDTTTSVKEWAALFHVAVHRISS